MPSFPPTTPPRLPGLRYSPHSPHWLALSPVGSHEGPSTFTAWYIGDETEPSFPTASCQLENQISPNSTEIATQLRITSAASPDLRISRSGFYTKKTALFQKFPLKVTWKKKGGWFWSQVAMYVHHSALPSCLPGGIGSGFSLYIHSSEEDF